MDKIYQTCIKLTKELIYKELEKDIDNEECLNLRVKLNKNLALMDSRSIARIQMVKLLIKEKILNQTENLVKSCTRCDLCKTRSNTVFGEGSVNAAVALLGEAPGSAEDRTGRPFVGKAGKLLDAILEKCCLKRKDIYILNIVKCRPPNNRNPKPIEEIKCNKYLVTQFKIIDPKFIVCLGRVAANSLLDTSSNLESLRQTWHTYGNAKVLCTFHPAYLLRSPRHKEDAWEDWQLLLKELGKQNGITS